MMLVASAFAGFLHATALGFLLSPGLLLLSPSPLALLKLGSGCHHYHRYRHRQLLLFFLLIIVASFVSSFFLLLSLLLLF